MRMRAAIVNQMTAFMLVCASVCSWHTAANEVRQETARDSACHWLGKAERWQLDPALAERQTLPKERLSLDQQAKPGLAVASAPAALAKTDAQYVHSGRLPSLVSSPAGLHSLFSISCLLLV